MSETGFAVFNVAVNVIEVFLEVWFVTTYLGYKETVTYRRGSFALAWFLVFCELQWVNQLFQFEGLLIFMTSLILLVYAVCVLNGKFLEKIFIALIPTCCITLTSSLAAGFLTVVVGANVYQLIENRDSVYILAVVVTKVMLFCIFSFIIRLKRGLKELPENRLWILFLIILFTSVITLFFAFLVMQSEFQETKYLYYLMMIIIGIVIMNIVTFYFLKRIGRETELRQEIGMLKQNAFYQQENVKQILQEQEHTRKIRHDMKNVMFAIQGMIEAGKIKDALAYCGQYMQKPVSHINVSNTGVQSMDSLIMYKLNLAADEGVQTKSRTSAITHIEIDDMHLCVILGNLLDNAIESLRLQEDDKCIEVIVEQNRQYVSIFVKNSIQESVLQNNPNLATTKGDKEFHGYGIRNVKELVEMYGGTIEFYEDAGMFVCHIEI